MTAKKIPASPDENKAPDPVDDKNENLPISAGPVPVFIVIGKTGAGKSSFIKLLGGRDMRDGQQPTVDDGLDSCTSTLAAYQTTVGGRKIILLDTPGFDDSACAENIETIIEIVSSLYCFAIGEDQFRVRGAIFLHDISETRFSGSQRKTLSTFRDMCGEQFMGNVIVGTTMWIPENEDTFLQQQRREQRFTKEHWSDMHKTARLFRNDIDAANQVITDLLNIPAVSLLVQDEMLRFPHTIENTKVGRGLKLDALHRIEQIPEENEERRVLRASVRSLAVRPSMSFIKKLGIIIATSIVLAPLAFISVPLAGALAGAAAGLVGLFG